MQKVFAALLLQSLHAGNDVVSFSFRGIGDCVSRRLAGRGEQQGTKDWLYRDLFQTNNNNNNGRRGLAETASDNIFVHNGCDCSERNRRLGIGSNDNDGCKCSSKSTKASKKDKSYYGSSSNNNNNNGSIDDFWETSTNTTGMGDDDDFYGGYVEYEESGMDTKYYGKDEKQSKKSSKKHSKKESSTKTSKSTKDTTTSTKNPKSTSMKSSKDGGAPEKTSKASATQPLIAQESLAETRGNTIPTGFFLHVGMVVALAVVSSLAVVYVLYRRESVRRRREESSCELSRFHRPSFEDDYSYDDRYERNNNIEGDLFVDENKHMDRRDIHNSKRFSLGSHSTL